MAIFGLNLAIESMNQKLSPLVLRDFTPSLDGVDFSVECLGCTLGACAADGPSILMGNDVLIAFITHKSFLSQRNCCS
jgi:hypothetical protein